MRYVLVALVFASASEEGRWTRLRLGGEEVEVYRDAYGIPHIFAKTPAGAFRAEGYLEAEDRLWQMETFRRAAKGEAAEIQGKAGLPNDRDRARRGYTEEEFGKLVASGDARMREAMAAYAEGVNAYLASGAPLPPEYEKLRIKPRPWAETDSMAIGVMMSRRFGEAGDLELTVSRVYDPLVRKVGEANAKLILADLLRDSDPSAPATLNDHVRKKADLPREKGARPGAPGMSPEAYARYRAELDEILASREALGVPAYFGSNAWVVAPGRSATGKAMLYAGPMMGFNAPSICNEIHLAAEGLNVAGMSFPGVPGVMIGWNDRVAWTTTSGGADLVDVYTLELNPENPDEYRHRGEWRKFEILEREIKVRGEASEKIKVYRSVYGPLAGEPDRKNFRAHALKMSFWMKEHRTVEAIFEVNVARSAGDFERAVRKIVTSHNFFCATADGRIGFWYCGAHPVRRAGHDVRFPQPGDGSMDWEGILPVERWPAAIDPPAAFFGNWNNKPARAWEPSGFGKVFWGKKILDVLESEPRIAFDRFSEIARLTAYHSYLADYFKPFILEAARSLEDEEAKKAAALLEGWDHMEVEGGAGPVLVERWVLQAAVRLFGDIVDPMLLASRQVQRFVVDPLLYVFEGEDCLVRLKYDYAKGKDLKAIARDALKEAMKGGVEKLAWKEPSIDFRGEVGSVKSKRGRGTYQMSVEIGPEGVRAVSLCAPGQSERPASRHYKDQVGFFAEWKYKPFVWRREEMK